MNREVRFTVTDAEYEAIAEYVSVKRRWRRVSDFLRDACFQTMERYPARIGHGASSGAAEHHGPEAGRKPVGGTAHADAGAFSDDGGMGDGA